MPQHRKRVESMLFNYESSQRTDYRDGEINPIITTQYQRKATCSRIMPLPLKDIHALTDWHRPTVPFDLFGKPKGIVGTSPHDVQKTFEPDPDLERRNVQKSRPRLFITPADSLDDMDDGPRKILTDNMYLTSKVFTTREVVSKAKLSDSFRAPFPGKPAPANPITIRKLSLPYVPEEWRMESVSWDSRQLRATAHPTRRFWLDRTSNCEECKNTATRDAIKKMKRNH